MPNTANHKGLLNYLVIESWSTSNLSVSPHIPPRLEFHLREWWPSISSVR
jgi:hypothetical protein